MATPKERVPTGLYDQRGQPLFRDPEKPRRRIDNYMVNNRTGLGTISRDKSLGVYTIAPQISDREAEEIYLASALAAKIVNIPVDDALMRWRTQEGEHSEEFKDAERRLNVKEKLSKAAKDARVYGTALVVMALADDAWDQPLNLDSIFPGMLRSLIVVDKRAISQVHLDRDLLSPTYGQAYAYDITFPRTYQTYRVDATRTLRFDGIISNSDRDFFQAQRRGLGTSIFVRLAEQLDMLGVSLQSLAHLETEAGMPVLGLQGYEDAMSTIESGSGEGTGASRLRDIHEKRSLYYMTIMSAEDTYQRLDVSFAGRAALLVEYRTMLSAAADIPMTRLFGQSPGGLNATGESDEKNYAVKIGEIQETVYDPALLVLDEVLAKDMGIPSAPTFKWEALLDISEGEQVANRAGEIETLMKANGGKPIMTMEESRYQFSTMKGMEWLYNPDKPLPEELVAPPPAEEEGGAEMGFVPGLGGGPPPMDSLPSGPGGDEYMDEPYAGDFDAGVEFSDEPLPEEVVAAALEAELDPQPEVAPVDTPFIPQRYGFRDWADGI